MILDCIILDFITSYCIILGYPGRPAPGRWARGMLAPLLPGGFGFSAWALGARIGAGARNAQHVRMCVCV